MAQLPSSAGFWGFLGVLATLVATAIGKIWKAFRDHSAEKVQLQTTINDQAARIRSLERQLDEAKERHSATQSLLVETVERSNRELIASHEAMRALNAKSLEFAWKANARGSSPPSASAGD